MTTALDNLIKAAKAVARHEQAYRQCARPERWPIMMPVGELLDLSDAVAAMEAAPAGAPALGEVESSITDIILRREGRHNPEQLRRLAQHPTDGIECAAVIKRTEETTAEILAALRHPQAPASGEVTREAVAQWLHDETDHPDAWSDYVWPDHPDDTGQREGAFVKIVPSDVQAKFREIAGRMVARFALSTSQPEPD